MSEAEPEAAEAAVMDRAVQETPAEAAEAAVLERSSISHALQRFYRALSP